MSPIRTYLDGLDDLRHLDLGAAFDRCAVDADQLVAGLERPILPGGGVVKHLSKCLSFLFNRTTSNSISKCSDSYALA